MHVDSSSANRALDLEECMLSDEPGGRDEAIADEDTLLERPIGRGPPESLRLRGLMATNGLSICAASIEDRD